MKIELTKQRRYEIVQSIYDMVETGSEVKFGNIKATWDQTIYGRLQKADDHTCKTQCCVAGAAVAAYDQRRFLRHVKQGYGGAGMIRSDAIKILGLSWDQAVWLFNYLRPQDEIIACLHGYLEHGYWDVAIAEAGGPELITSVT